MKLTLIELCLLQKDFFSIWKMELWKQNK